LRPLEKAGGAVPFLGFGGVAALGEGGDSNVEVMVEENEEEI